jgi:hypothetical protein
MLLERLEQQAQMEQTERLAAQVRLVLFTSQHTFKE